LMPQLTMQGAIARLSSELMPKKLSTRFSGNFRELLLLNQKLQCAYIVIYAVISEDAATIGGGTNELGSK
jgi:hypothetical protein